MASGSAEDYELCHAFLTKLDRLDFDSFKPFLQLTIERFLGSSIKELREVGETFSNWREEICDSYIEVPGFGKLNNSLSEGFTKAEAIRLLSCNTGAHPEGFAQHLANALGKPVYASNMTIHSYPNGTHWLSDNGKEENL